MVILIALAPVKVALGCGRQQQPSTWTGCEEPVS